MIINFNAVRIEAETANIFQGRVARLIGTIKHCPYAARVNIPLKISVSAL